MNTEPKKPDDNEEPTPAQEEDVAVDKPDPEGEEMMKAVRNERMVSPEPK